MEKNEDPRIAEKWVFGVPPRPGPYFYGPNWHTSHVMGVVFDVEQQQPQQEQQEQQEQEQQEQQEWTFNWNLVSIVRQLCRVLFAVPW